MDDLEKPAWQTDELDVEWIEPEEPEEEGPRLTSAHYNHTLSDISFTEPIGSLMVQTEDLISELQLPSSSAAGGTFLVREDVPAAPLLPKTPGGIKKGLVKDFFSPLALEKMFEPPSPPPNNPTSLPPAPSTAPAVPSRLSQVYIPDQDTSVTEGELGSERQYAEDSREEKLEDTTTSGHDIATAGYQFTFAAPRRSPFNPMGPVPDAQSTPGPPQLPIPKGFNAPPTDPRLRLFHFQYDTFTRDHLSAMVDSIAVNTPSGGSAGGNSVDPVSSSDVSRASDGSISRLRSVKRIKLSPASDFSGSGDGAAVILRPDATRKDYVGESKSFMEKIRQARDFSTVSTVGSARSPPNRSKGVPLADRSPNRRPSFLNLPDAEHNKDPSPAGTTSSKRSTYSSLAYREQAANLMAQIRDDVINSGRLISAGTETSQLVHEEEEQEYFARDTSPDYGGDTEILPDVANDQGHWAAAFTDVPHLSAGEASSSHTDLRRSGVADPVDRELAQSLAQISLDSERLLEQFPAPPIGFTITAPPTAPSSPVITLKPDHGHLSAPAGTSPAYPSSSIRAGRDDDLTRFVSSSTASGTTLTTGSANASTSSKPQASKQITHIAPSDVPALPDRVGKMVFDKVMMKWVKATAGASAQETKDAAATDGGNDSEDPFRDFESLREDDSMSRHDDFQTGTRANSQTSEFSPGLEKSRAQDAQSDSELEDEEEAELTSFSFDGPSADVPSPADESYRADTESEDGRNDDTETTVDTQADNADVDYEDANQRSSGTGAEGQAPALQDGPRTLIPHHMNVLSTPRPASRAAVGPASISVIRSALKNTPSMRTPANGSVHIRSVSFSDGKKDGPIRGIGRNIPTPDGTVESEVEDMGLPAASGGSPKGNRDLVPSARSKRIADMLDNLGESVYDDESPSKASSRAPLTDELQPLTVDARRRPTSQSIVNNRRIFSQARPENSSRLTDKNATFLTECSFGLAHDRLVQVITDVQPFEPYWDELSAIDLSKKNIDSAVRLKEFLPRLDSLSLNSNQLSWLSGIPGTVRTLSVASNCLTSITSFNHLLNLENLDISRNSIDSLRQLECLRHLRELRADGNGINSLDGLQHMDGLIKLSLQANNIRDVDLTLFRWSRLEMLNLSSNKLGNIVGLASLPALIALNLDENNLGELETSSPMPRLKILRASGNRLQRLNAAPFPNLRTLYADNNSLGPIVKAHRLTKLENLSLRNQSGRAGLSLSIRDVRDVKRLYLSGNPMKHGFMSEPCYNLVYLELAACRLTSLPPELSRLVPNVRVLNLNYNFLEDVRPLEGLTRLRKLTIIGSRVKATKQLVRVLRGMLDMEMVDFRMNPCTLGWYLPLLVKDIPGALQPSDSGTVTGASAGTQAPVRGEEGTRRLGSKSRGVTQSPPAEQSAHPMGPSSLPPESLTLAERDGAGSPAEDSNGPRASAGLRQGVTWKDLDSKFRRDLPDEAYVGRLAYRGLVMRSCPAIRMLDGVEVSAKEKDKAESLLKSVFGARKRKAPVQNAD